MADLIQYVTLGISKELLAVPVDLVREILQVRPIARLPQAPAHLLGMIDVRGTGVPVIDLRLKLGFEPTPDTENTRIVVLDVAINGRDTVFGLKTDRVFEVTVLDEEALDRPPEIGTKWRSGFIAGIGRRNGAFVTVLDLGYLFVSDELALTGDPVESDRAA
jgi:purine-binding chemotaxis protein CheW